MAGNRNAGLYAGEKIPAWKGALRAIAEFELLLYAVASLFWLVSFGFKYIKVINTRPFFVNDATLWYEYAEDPLVSSTALIILELGQLALLSLLDMLLSIYLLHAVYRSWTKVLQLSLCSAVRMGFGGLAATGITAAMVGLVKLFVGRLRPDYGHRCLGPDADLPTLQFDSAVLWGAAECVTDEDLNPLASTLDYDARVSFVSGHSAGAFGVGVFVMLVCLYRTWCIVYWRAFDHDHDSDRTSSLPQPLFSSLIPVHTLRCTLAHSLVLSHTLSHTPHSPAHTLTHTCS